MSRVRHPCYDIYYCNGTRGSTVHAPEPWGRVLQLVTAELGRVTVLLQYMVQSCPNEASAHTFEDNITSDFMERFATF